MSQITQEFQKLGMVVPLNKRVWMWLKDHPRKSCREVSVALNADNTKVAAALSDLEKRLMIVSEKEMLSLRRSSVGRNLIKVYTVSPSMKEYDLLPVKKATIPRESGFSAKVIKAEAPLAPVKKKISLDDLSIKEAKELYEELKGIFG